MLVALYTRYIREVKISSNKISSNKMSTTVTVKAEKEENSNITIIQINYDNDESSFDSSSTRHVDSVSSFLNSTTRIKSAESGFLESPCELIVNDEDAVTSKSSVNLMEGSYLAQTMLKNGKNESSKSELKERPKKLNNRLMNLRTLMRFSSLDYWRNNKSFLTFLFLILLTNAIFFVHRAVYFSKFPMLNGFAPNIFYMISRACGRTILFNTVLILVTVLRYTITLLRKLGFANYIPLDHNIYFHKIVGCLIFFQGMTHSIMHLINFYINIQPDPIKFIYLSWSYWYDDGYYPLTSYTLPTGCTLVSVESENSEFCLKDSMVMPLIVNFDVSRNISLCQACTTGIPYSYYDWILTTKPGLFGMKGIASLSGVALMIILIVMFICALPVVRRSGHFQIFYFTHMLYFGYFILLFFHAPEFWKWFLIPAIIWMIEILYRSVGTFLGHGKTVVKAGVLLPSKVTNLIIKRPARFNFNAGDMVFVKIPAVAQSEWHPFTISSAPEVKDEFTIHIRGVGGWTNSLYSFFEKENLKQQNLNKNTKNVFNRKCYRSIRHHDKISSSKVIKYLDYGANIQEAERNGNKKIDLLEKPLEIYIDGPFGCPASNIYRAEHAVLIGTGIGVTPFASILQSIMHRYWEIKQNCPNCHYSWSTILNESMFNLKKIDFFWINRNIDSFEWFVDLLSQLEAEQAEQDGQFNRFLDLHMYVTRLLQKDEIKSSIKYVNDSGTGLKAKTGRPNWDMVFNKIKMERKGEVTIFYCGNRTLATQLKYKCDQFGFKFRKETF